MQNTSPVFSVPASATNLAAFRRMKLGSTGAAYAGVGDVCVGTSISGWNDPGGDKVSAIQDINFGLHFATVGNGTDIAVGDELEAFANGQVVKRTTGAAVGVALETATEIGHVIRVKYYPTGNSFKVVAAGIYVWAGGVATTDSISVPGLLPTDIVLATLVQRSATQQLAVSVNDEANDQIDLTLSAAGANGGEKIAYAVLRA